MPKCGIASCGYVTMTDSSFCEIHQTGKVQMVTYDELKEIINKQKVDMVNQPPHYTAGNLEVIDILKDQLTPEEYEGFLKGNILKYTLRYRLKNGLQDLKKSEWYLKKLIELKKTL
jgi:hypothetical protein